MHVFHGPVEISGQVYNYAQAIRGCGHEATAAVFEPHKYGYPFDELIYRNGNPGKWPGRFQRLRYTASALRRFDVFNYWFARTILGGYDLRAASLLGKPVVMTFCGSEIRSMREAAEKSPYIDPESWPKSPVDTDYLEWLNANIDVAMVRYHELAPYVEHHFEDVVYVPRAVDCDRIQPEEFGSTDAIHIAHAPSNREVKGTEFLEDAVHDLQSEGHNIALEIIEGKHDEVVRQLQRADIVVDQLRIGTFGNLALEAMATETPVVCYLRDDLRDKYPDSLPIVNGTPNDIQEVLRDLITDQTRRKALGEAGREYVLAHHRLSLVGRKLANLYETL